MASGRVIERAQNVGNPSRILHAEPAPVSGREAATMLLLSMCIDLTGQGAPKAMRNS
jgi:hypothetical protein